MYVRVCVIIEANSEHAAMDQMRHIASFPLYKNRHCVYIFIFCCGHESWIRNTNLFQSVDWENILHGRISVLMEFLVFKIHIDVPSAFTAQPFRQIEYHFSCVRRKGRKKSTQYITIYKHEILEKFFWFRVSFSSDKRLFPIHVVQSMIPSIFYTYSEHFVTFIFIWFHYIATSPKNMTNSIFFVKTKKEKIYMYAYCLIASETIYCIRFGKIGEQIFCIWFDQSDSFHSLHIPII